MDSTTDKNSRDMKAKFSLAVKIAFAFLMVVFVLILVLPGPAVLLKLKQPERVAIFSLCVDLVMGTFTIWGLYWAATQFAESAIKPVLKLLPARGTGSHSHNLSSSIEKFPVPMRNAPFHMQGRREISNLFSVIPNPTPHILCGLFLENEKSRAGRYVTMQIFFEATPAPDLCQFHHRSNQPETSPLTIKGEKIFDSDIFFMTIQFSEHLVVYQAPVFVGVLEVFWHSKLTDNCFPKDAVLRYKVFTLDGASHNKMQLLIDWETKRPTNP